MLIKAWYQHGESHLESEERSAEMSTASAIGLIRPTAPGVFELASVESGGFPTCFQPRRGPRSFTHRTMRDHLSTLSGNNLNVKLPTGFWS